MRIPGMIPAMKRSPGDVWEAEEYTIKERLGGMITPRPPATVTIAVENILSYPILIKNGIVMAPTAETVAGDEPDMAA